MADADHESDEAGQIGAELLGHFFGLMQRGVVALENIARSKGFEPD